MVGPDEVPNAAVSVTGLTKRFGRVTAIEDVTLEIPPGVVFALLGPNGSGKSTTLACIGGLLDPTRGTVHVLGDAQSTRASTVKRRVGVLPDPLGLLDRLTADEMLHFHGRMLGLDEATTRARIEELLMAFELRVHRGRPLGELSHGMRKKVGVAAALIHDPRVLLLDEPFEGLDLSTTRLLEGWFRRMADGGSTVLLTSHDLAGVARLCDRAALLVAGRVAWQDDIEDLRRGGALELDGRLFQSLDALVQEVTRIGSTRLTWLPGADAERS